MGENRDTRAAADAGFFVHRHQEAAEQADLQDLMTARSRWASLQPES